MDSEDHDQSLDCTLRPSLTHSCKYLHWVVILRICDAHELHQNNGAYCFASLYSVALPTISASGLHLCNRKRCVYVLCVSFGLNVLME
jgi:hypothetical protein